MTQLIPESWQQALGHVRDNIHQVIDRWWHRQPAETQNGQVEVVQRGEVARGQWLPAMVPSGFNVEETDDALIVRAEVPALGVEHYTVELSGGRLVIRGEQRQSSEHRDRDYYYAEQSYGAFARILPLPCEVDANAAQAHYQHGVLRVTLPKTAGARAKRVKVEIREQG